MSHHVVQPDFRMIREDVSTVFGVKMKVVAEHILKDRHHAVLISHRVFRNKNDARPCLGDDKQVSRR